MSKKVLIAAGHSNSDPGAVNGKLHEAVLVAKFRNAVVYYLNKAGLSVLTDGEGATNLPLSTVIQLAKRSGVYLAVEFHLNASVNPKATGVETISLPKDKALSQAISKAVADSFGLELRGDKGWIDQSKSNRGRLGFVEAGGLIAELGFISNVNDRDAFNEKYWLAAKTVAQVIIDHLVK